MPTSFDAALGAAVELLRGLSRDRKQTAESKARFAEFRARHPGTPARLSVDCRPGWPFVEFDVLLVHPERGTVGVTWRRDDGSPWTVEYADHWASNFVVTLGGKAEGGVTVQEALLTLKLATDRQPDLMERIVEEKLVALCIEADPPPVDPEELQAASDAFRAANGLTMPGDMRRRLEEWGITLQRYEHMLGQAIQRRKLRERVTAAQVEPYFEAHRAELSRVRVLRASAPVKEVLERLMGAAREGGLASALARLAADPSAEGVETALATRLAEELPHPFATSSAPGLVAPFEHEGRWVAGEILAHLPAVLDARTRDDIQRRLFRRFLQEKREAAGVEWRWL